MTKLFSKKLLLVQVFFQAEMLASVLEANFLCYLVYPLSLPEPESAIFRNLMDCEELWAEDLCFYEAVIRRNTLMIPVNWH